ncbi:hypothetical protein RchiOBHm_Chr1g0326981 [Rosa chinensis]|uniref:Uncharacterized protein n=1 Tax=Rosa chinensis TaxID=74649 RepID=A0A2P6SAG5_ROSCH|nr:hypothetical protein RchiOBHm_Chr1g0326981 [Rosa chinensis]
MFSPGPFVFKCPDFRLAEIASRLKDFGNQRFRFCPWNETRTQISCWQEPFTR